MTNYHNTIAKFTTAMMLDAVLVVARTAEPGPFGQDPQDEPYALRQPNPSPSMVLKPEWASNLSPHRLPASRDTEIDMYVCICREREFHVLKLWSNRV